MRRRHLLAALGATVLGGAALPLRAATTRQMPLSKAFRYLDVYLGLAPALRSRFHLVFLALRNEQPAPDLRGVIIDADGQSHPLALNAVGEVTNLPSLAELKSDAALDIDGAGFRFATEIRPDVEPSTHLDVGQLDLSIAQANTAISHLAGAFAVVAPRLDVMLFPDAGGGQAVMADGRTAPLPLTSAVKALGPTPYFEPSRMAGARSLALIRTPSRIILAVRPI